jgi:16S rRNA C1402 (ribose-2'-O) methylase RsmI
VAAGRELTKLHEEVLRGSASSVASLLESRPGIKGEFAIAVSAAGTPDAGGRKERRDDRDTAGVDPDPAADGNEP